MDLKTGTGYVRRVEPLASNWRSACWSAGSFDTGRRSATDVVEGLIRTPHHMLLVNIRGGAEHLTVATDCGHRYEGPDRPGAVSFVPGNCERRLRCSVFDPNGPRSRFAPNSSTDRVRPIRTAGAGSRLQPLPMSRTAFFRAPSANSGGC
jgi:hypothetical protein